MSQNPLQTYFRQPKIYLKLPSLGKYTDPASISGTVENLPIFGMTGMDQIIIKTPDALLNGESTIKIIQSCCPNIINAWNVTNLDIDCLLVAIRVATFGNTMSVASACSSCGAENEYDVDLGKFLEHYASCVFNTSVVVGDLIVKLKPMTYKNVTSFSLENFSLQKQLIQISNMEDGQAKQDMLGKAFSNFAILQNRVLVDSIDQIETPNGVVTEFGFIKEWVDNCDQQSIATIRKTMDENKETWQVPASKAVCSSCGNVDQLEIELDQASFFANA